MDVLVYIPLLRLNGKSLLTIEFICHFVKRYVDITKGQSVFDALVRSASQETPIFVHWAVMKSLRASQRYSQLFHFYNMEIFTNFDMKIFTRSWSEYRFKWYHRFWYIYLTEWKIFNMSFCIQQLKFAQPDFCSQYPIHGFYPRSHLSFSASFTLLNAIHSIVGMVGSCCSCMHYFWLINPSRGVTSVTGSYVRWKSRFYRIVDENLRSGIALR